MTKVEAARAASAYTVLAAAARSMGQTLTEPSYPGSFLSRHGKAMCDVADVFADRAHRLLPDEHDDLGRVQRPALTLVRGYGDKS